MQNLPVIKKAFLATKNVAADMFLLTERHEKESGASFVFFIIECNNEKNGKRIHKQINSLLIKDYLSAQIFSLSLFENSLNDINKYLQSGDIVGSNGNTLNIFIGLCDNQTLHLSMIGNIEGYLFRKGKVNSLTEGLGNNQEMQFSNITSGEMKQSDTIIIGNRNFFDRMSLDRIRKTLELFSPSQAIKDFFKIFKKNRYLDCNAVVIRASSAQEAREEDESPDMIYLDEIEESKVIKIYKKAKPTLDKTKNIFFEYLSKFSKFLSGIFSALQNKWQSEYKQKTKEIVSKTSSSAKIGLSNITSNIENNYRSKKSGIKVKSYNSSDSQFGQKISFFFRQAVSFFKKAAKKENRKYLYIAIIIIFVLISYIKISSNDKNRDVIKKQNDAEFAVEKAQELLKTANEDISLGRSNGVSQLNDALNYAKSALEIPSTQEKAKNIIDQVLVKMDEITLTTRIRQTEPIFSFKNKASVSAITGSIIYGITEDGKIYFSDAREKDPRLISAVDAVYGKPVSAVFSETSNLLYILTDKPSVWAFDPLSQSGAEVRTEGFSWENGSAISTYSSNLYILDPIQGKIWRHNKSGDSYNKGVSFAGANNEEAKNGISMAIDGSIFILKTEGKIVKFSHGTSDSSFNLKNPPDPQNSINGSTQIYADADSQNIFLLDQTNNRVLKYAKDGEFIRQYTIDDKKISSFLVNPRIQKMWFVCGEEVFELDI
ncbi:MAG: hypothetical protein BWY19_00571 [bacterium ADurb.Bin212]|nr:MAG: hypothetical protein BWY19_00571 [bacterium ADurb.Bin212]